MTISRSPANRWTQEHRGGPRRTHWKIAWRTRWRAMIHAAALMNTYGDRLYLPYRCHWTADYREGEVGRTHWHVGQLGTADIRKAARAFERKRGRQQHAAPATQAEADRS